MLENTPLQSAIAESEDNLFKALCKPSLYEMREKYRDLITGYDWSVEDRTRLFMSNGWTLKEFCQKHRDLGLQLPHD